MKQRIDVKVTIKKDKDRSKAMQIVAGTMGVSSVTVGGEDKNILIVIGNQVDPVALTKALMKKLGSATLVRVVPLINDGGFDHEEAGGSMIYQGQSNNYGNYTYGQPISYYNSDHVLPQYPHDRPYEYYQYYQTPGEW